MNAPRVVRAGEAENEWAWLAADGSTLVSGDAAAVAAWAGDTPVRVLLPAFAVGLTQVSMPARNVRQARLAAPYAIEDQIVGEVTELHFAFGPFVPATPYPLAYVDGARLEAWLAPLVSAGVTVDGAWSEVLAVPPPAAGEWNAMHTARGWLVRTGLYTGFAADDALLATVLCLLAADERPRRIAIASNDDTMPDTRTWPEDIASSVTRASRAPFARLADGLATRPPLDLLPERLQRSGGNGRRRVFAAAAVLAVLAFGVHVASLVSHVNALERELAAVREAQHTLFNGAFPEITRIVNPVAQARQALAAREAAATPPGHFLDALNAVSLAHATPETETIAVQALNYGAGEMHLTVQAPSVANVERFGALLGSNGTFRAEIRSAEGDADGVTSRLRVVAE